MKRIAGALSRLALMLMAAALLPTLGGCQPKPATPQVAESAPRVRVRLLAGVNRVVLTAGRTTVVRDSARAREVGLSLDPGRDIELTYDGTTWRCGEWSLSNTPSLRIDPAADGAVAVNGSPYRGSYTIEGTGPNKIDVINEVDVENYLRGVLARELFADWQPEAYKAQAVIARTYALYEIRTNPTGRSWDLNPDERSQVYGGMKAETAKATAAVAATQGMVVAYGQAGGERIFKAYFSSCCGGVAASAADVFNEPATPPLSAHNNGRTCAISPKFSWPAVAFSKAELTRRIRAWGTKQGRAEATLPGVRTIEIASLNAFGRPRSFVLTDMRGQQYLLTAEQMRWAINSDPNGGPTILSGYFRPVDAGDSIRLDDGHGFGHGVGACQWCMQGRALAGQPWQTIVTSQYPQSVLVRAY